MEKKPYRRLALCAFSLTFAVAAGCGGAAALTRANEISVVSDPPGAAVHAAGKRRGVTPLVVRQQDVFPVVYGPEQQDAYGTLLLAKDGCKDHTVRVTNEVIRQGVNVKLNCGQADLARPQAGAPGSPPLVGLGSYRFPLKKVFESCSSTFWATMKVVPITHRLSSLFVAAPVSPSTYPINTVHLLGITPSSARIEAAFLSFGRPALNTLVGLGSALA